LYFERHPKMTLSFLDVTHNLAVLTTIEQALAPYNKTNELTALDSTGVHAPVVKTIWKWLNPSESAGKERHLSEETVRVGQSIHEQFQKRFPNKASRDALTLLKVLEQLYSIFASLHETATTMSSFIGDSWKLQVTKKSSSKPKDTPSHTDVPAADSQSKKRSRTDDKAQRKDKPDKVRGGHNLCRGCGSFCSNTTPPSALTRTTRTTTRTTQRSIKTLSSVKRASRATSFLSSRRPQAPPRPSARCTPNSTHSTGNTVIM
jgi:hypothetical protein